MESQRHGHIEPRTHRQRSGPAGIRPATVCRTRTEIRILATTGNPLCRTGPHEQCETSRCLPISTIRQILLGVLWDQWNAVFKNTLGHAERSIVSELRDVRNRWAHNEQFSSNDAIRALDSMERLLNAVSAAEAATEVGQMRMDLMRTMFDEQRR